jgi:hypothetical protein
VSHRKAKARATEQTVNAGLASEHFGKRLRGKAKAKRQHLQSVNGGHVTIGRVSRCGEGYLGAGTSGRVIGTFVTQQAAVRAFDRGGVHE